MKQGLLWFDDDPRIQLEEKVQRAASHYEAKHGRSPNLCFVHSTALGDNGNGKVRTVPDGPVRCKAGEVEIRIGRSVLRHHYWLGVVEKKKPRQIKMKLPEVER